jgi:hypothetical protein
MLMLGALGLFSTRPWETTSVVPSLAVSPGLGAALGDSVEVVPAGGPQVASARVAPEGPSAQVAAPVVVSGPDADRGSSLLAVSPGRAVERSEATNPASPAPSGPPSSPAPAAQPVAAAPEPAPAPVVPVAAPAPPLVASTGSRGPATSGVIVPGEEVEPAPSCEGDEYLFTVTPESAEAISEESELDIVIQRFATDGSESELRVEGHLSDVRSLVALLLSEGNCVRVVFESAEEDDAGAEAPEAPADGEESGGMLVPLAP